MPTVRAERFEGGTPQQEAALARERSAACVRVLGCSAASVDVLLFDTARQDGATGGVLWSERAPDAPLASGRP